MSHEWKRVQRTAHHVTEACKACGGIRMLSRADASVVSGVSSDRCVTEMPPALDPLPFDEKAAGQRASLDYLSELDRAMFVRLIADFEVGAEFSVNELRSALDSCQIPEKARAGLFAHAVARGLIEPMTVWAGSRLVPVQVQSTGRSAHRALVRVYRRLAVAA